MPRTEEVCRPKKGLEMNFKQGEKVLISPVGQVYGIDGRYYSVDPDTVINSIVENDLHIPLEEEHWGGPAAGWFDKGGFESRADGIYASLELNDMGKDFVENKKYKYLSPVYIIDEERNVVGIDSVGLVNRPNLKTQEMNNRNKENNNPKEDEMAADEKTERKINELKEENSRLKTEAESNEKQIKDLKEENSQLKQTIKESKIDKAVEDGKLLPNQKDFAKSLDDDKLEKFLEQNEVNVEHLKKKTETDDSAQHVDDLTANFAKQIGLDDEKLKKYVNQ